jgi:hypothetical protein
VEARASISIASAAAIGCDVVRPQEVREGRVELPRPLGHRILRLLALYADSGPARLLCRRVPARVVLS